MSFIKKTWVNGEIIYAVDLNRMEEGIAEANKAVEQGSVHTHGNITFDGRIGTFADRIITTGANGVLQASTPEEARAKLGMGNALDDINNNARRIEALETYEPRPYMYRDGLVCLVNYEGMPMDCTVEFEPVQSGSGAPTPDNVRQISGRDKLKLYRAGKNLVMNIKPAGTIDDPKGNPGVTFTRNEDGSIVVNGSVAEDAASYAEYVMTSSTTLYLPAGRYYVSGPPAELFGTASDGTGPAYFQVSPFDAGAGSSVYDYGQGRVFTLTKGSYVYLVIRIRKGYSVNNAVFRPQIECIEQTDYEPYQVQPVSLNLGQTVYSGTLDVNTGLLTIDKKCYSFSGNEDIYKMSSEASQVYQKESSIFYYKGMTDAKPGIGTSICSHFTNNGNVIYSTVYDGSVGIYCDNLDTSPVPYYKYFRWGTADSTAEDFKAFLSDQADGTPVQICYELAEPVTVQLDPMQILAYHGVNTLWIEGDGENLTVSGRTDILWLTSYLAEQIKKIPTYSDYEGVEF